MALGAIALRFSIISILCGIWWICQRVEIRGRIPISCAELVSSFPTCLAVWYVASTTWAIMLIARYCRQAIRQENTTWRRHALVDFLLWISAWCYWAAAVNGLFLEDPSQLTISIVMGISLLSEEMIRFYYAERMYCFHNCFMESTQIVMLFWHLVCVAASGLILIWTGLFSLVCALHLDTVSQVKNALLISCSFWWFLVLFRYCTLYLRVLRRDHRNGAMFADETTDAILYIV